MQPVPKANPKGPLDLIRSILPRNHVRNQVAQCPSAMNLLPPDVLRLIFVEQSFKDWVKCSLVCKAWSQVVQPDLDICREVFSEIILHTKNAVKGKYGRNPITVGTFQVIAQENLLSISQIAFSNNNTASNNHAEDSIGLSTRLLQVKIIFYTETKTYPITYPIPMLFGPTHKTTHTTKISQISATPSLKSRSLLICEMLKKSQSKLKNNKDLMLPPINHGARPDARIVPNIGHINRAGGCVGHTTPS